MLIRVLYWGWQVSCRRPENGVLPRNTSIAGALAPAKRQLSTSFSASTVTTVNSSTVVQRCLAAINDEYAGWQTWLVDVLDRFERPPFSQVGASRRAPSYEGGERALAESETPRRHHARILSGGPRGRIA